MSTCLVANHNDNTALCEVHNKKSISSYQHSNLLVYDIAKGLSAQVIYNRISLQPGGGAKRIQWCDSSNFSFANTNMDNAILNIGYKFHFKTRLRHPLLWLQFNVTFKLRESLKVLSINSAINKAMCEQIKYLTAANQYVPSYIDEDASHSSPLETEKCMMDHHMALFGSFKASIITPSDFVTLTRQSLLSRCECTCTPVCVASSLPQSIFIYFICQCSCLTQTLLCRLCKDLFSYYNGSYCNIIIDTKILSKPTELKVLFNSPSPFQ